MATDICVVCKGPVDWRVVSEIFGHILKQVDRYGEESLTEHEQVVYHGHCCSEECYEKLD